MLCSNMLQHIVTAGCSPVWQLVTLKLSYGPCMTAHAHRFHNHTPHLGLAKGPILLAHSGTSSFCLYWPNSCRLLPGCACWLGCPAACCSCTSAAAAAEGSASRLLQHNNQTENSSRLLKWGDLAFDMMLCCLGDRAWQRNGPG